jgi:hypothetical protein
LRSTSWRTTADGLLRLYTFVEDLRGEGAAQPLDRVLGYGCTSLTVAAAYVLGVPGLTLFGLTYLAPVAVFTTNGAGH